MSNQPSCLVTGGTGGLGLASARYLVGQGWRVFVADCNQQALDELAGESGLEPVFMDVTDSQSVQGAFDTINGKVDSLEGIVNFAGILRVGSMAELAEEEMLAVMQINVMGTFRVNQVFLPLLNRGNGRSRIINISSETGWQSGGPFNGAYAMSKHAIEAYSDSLRRELMFMDIPVIKIQPGPFKTNMVASIESNFSRAVEQSNLFKRQLERIKGLAMREQDKAHDPRLIAEAIHKALTVAKPAAAYSVKADPARSFLEYLPTRWADALLRLVLGRS